MTTLQAAPAITSSRQRVLDTLAHKQPDQVPVDFGGTPVTGIHVRAVYVRIAHMQPTTADSRVADHRCFPQPRSGVSS